MKVIKKFRLIGSAFSRNFTLLSHLTDIFQIQDDVDDKTGTFIERWDECQSFEMSKIRKRRKYMHRVYRYILYAFESLTLTHALR